MTHCSHRHPALLFAIFACGLPWSGACTVSASGDDGSAAASETGDEDTSGGDDGGEELPPGCEYAGTEGATAACLTPTKSPEYYVAQAEYYFDTLDTTAPEENVPDYHAQVARWEWPPWLLLTGYGVDAMVEGNALLKMIDPSTVPNRDCRFFDTQPF
ncbi:MAG: hypothetical protein ACPHRO_04255, partial [Nannocystaceae bacterium]